ncbi:MAG: ABC transporter permease [Betaproteobacteria bacterium]
MSGTSRGETIKIAVARAALCALILIGWQMTADRGWINPILIGRPTEMFQYLYQELVVTGSLLQDLKWTLVGVASAFTIGAVAGIAVGLLFATQPFVERLLDPFIIALNAMPRIALAPLFIIWFGLGVGSKIALGVSLTFFVVLAATTAGVRSVNPDHLTLAQTLGASGSQIFRMFVLPNSVPVVFSGLRLGLVVALLGVVGGEVIAAEHGLGQALAVLAASFRTSGVFALILFLAAIGVAVTWLMDRIEARLLRWR